MGKMIEFVRVPKKVFEFLMGEQPLEGYWFGDRRPGRGSFWWRSVLRKESLDQPLMTHSKSEYKRLKALGADVLPPSTSAEETWAQAPEPVQSSTSVEDDKRFEWLERFVFERKWDGTIGRPSTWHMAGPHRHELVKMRGSTLREAIDEAMKEKT